MEDSFVANLSSHQSFYLNTWHFLALSAVAIVVMRLLPLSAPRHWLLMLLNIYFVSYFVADLASAIGVAVILSGTYAIGTARLRWGEDAPGWVFPSIVVALWVLLFLIKDASLFPLINPFHYQPIQIIGISYLMFRSINYVVDVEVLEDHSFLTFCNFMIFFPALLAGPIARYDDFQDSHDTQKAYSAADVMPLLHRIANGCIKKFVIADNLAAIGIFAQPHYADASVALLWVSVLAQLFIFYMDFSGYTDIVIGVAGLMGFRMPENFNRPFRAVNLQEFWTRWHMSMTSFIRDYVFTPLSRQAIVSLDRRWHFWVFLLLSVFTMMLIALWHATTWGFVVFGMLHGVVLVLLQLKRRYLPNVMSGKTALEITAARVITYVYISMTVTLWYHGVQGTGVIVGRMFGLMP